jgi:hypothetical protein
LIRETTENESANEGYRFGQEEETYNIVADFTQPVSSPQNPPAKLDSPPLIDSIIIELTRPIHRGDDEASGSCETWTEHVERRREDSRKLRFLRFDEERRVSG